MGREKCTHSTSALFRQETKRIHEHEKLGFERVFLSERRDVEKKAS